MPARLAAAGGGALPRAHGGRCVRVCICVCVCVGGGQGGAGDVQWSGGQRSWRGEGVAVYVVVCRPGGPCGEGATQSERAGRWLR